MRRTRQADLWFGQSVLSEASSVSPMAKRKRPNKWDAGFYESGDGGEQCR